MHHFHFPTVIRHRYWRALIFGLKFALAVSFTGACGTPTRASAPPSMQSASAPSEAQDAALVRRFQDVHISVDVSGGHEEPSVAEVGKHITRCSTEKRRCFVTLRLLRPLAGIFLLRTGLLDEGLRKEWQYVGLAGGVHFEVIRDGKPTPSADFAKACLVSRSTCELPVDLDFLENAKAGAIFVVDIFTSPLPEEVAAEEREERARRAAEEKACEDACANKGLCIIDLDGCRNRGTSVARDVAPTPPPKKR